MSGRSQADILSDARLKCICPAGTCLEDECPGCADLDPELPCLHDLHAVD